MTKRTRKVLLIDDDPALTRLLSSVFRQEGLQVAVGNEPGDSLTLVAREKPDLVVLDICMPRLDGWEICRQIREQGWRMPILVLTVLSDTRDVERTYQCGASAHMSKPFSINDLLSCVRALLAKPAGRQVRGACGSSFEGNRQYGSSD